MSQYIYLVVVVISALVKPFCTQAEEQQAKNIVIILADDLGWNDTNIFQNSQFLETPNIDALASKGMTFTHSYTNSPLCSPTRASILTGQTPAKHGSTTPSHHLAEVRLVPSIADSTASNKRSVAPMSVTRLDTQIPTLSSILKTNNYHTAHFGKWHLGASPYSPLEHGFDLDIPHYDGPGPAGGFLAPWSFAPDIQPQIAGEHIDIRLAQEARQWLLNISDNNPFFLNFWAFSVHAPFNADPELISYFESKRSPFHSQRSATYAAMVKHFDDAVGILWDALVEAGVEDNTIIIFTSDNGGNMYDVLGTIHATSNFPLRGGKATNYDGGIRVPTAIIWPGLTTPNTLSDTPIQSVDFFPTLLSGANLSWPASHPIDGLDIRDILSGTTIDSRAIFTFYPAEPRVPDWLPPSATVTKDGWKLIRTFHYGENGGHLFQLFDIDSDPSEANNLAKIRPDIVTQLDGLLETHLIESKAFVPIANPSYRSGAFKYELMGVPSDTYLLPEEKVNLDFGFKIRTDHQIVSTGETVKITYELENATNSVSVNYRQFMGPSVNFEKNGNEIIFVVPEVPQAEYIGLAFIANDGGQTIRQQISVRVNPTQIAPQLSITQVNQKVTKGGVAVFNISASDANKDFIRMDVHSEDLPANSLKQPPTEGEYQIDIPSDYPSSAVTIFFSAEDIQHKTEKTITISISAIENNAPTKPGGGGGFSRFMPFFIILILLIRLRKRSLNRANS